MNDLRKLLLIGLAVLIYLFMMSHYADWSERRMMRPMPYGAACIDPDSTLVRGDNWVYCEPRIIRR